jgi:hypothetical protein
LDTRVASRLPFGTAILLAIAVLASCGPSVGSINGRPDQFYGKRISLTGRIGDVLLRDGAGKAVVFHLVAGNGGRIIVVTSRGTSRRQGDRVRVRGTFAAEHTVGDKTFYDVVVTDRVRRPGWLTIPLV